MITIRPSVFCFLGKVAPELYGTVPAAIRRRLGVVPDVFAFISVVEDSIDLKLGTKRPRLPPVEGNLQNRLWHALTFASAAIGNIRVRTDALRRPADTPRGFQIVRGGPDIYLVQCLSEPMGWELVFAVAEKIHDRNELPPSAGRGRGVFPLFHLPSADEDLEREQALEGLRRLEKLVRRGVLFPSIVLDRVNRNGYPLERWEDLTELLSDFLALGTASEAAPDIWRTFPQVADLHGLAPGAAGAIPAGTGAVPGLSSIGLARFRFSREALGAELGRMHLRDLKRALARTFTNVHPHPGDGDCREFLDVLLERKASSDNDGMKAIERAIVEWVRAFDPEHPPLLGAWAHAVDRLQGALFERMGESSQRIENVRQDIESLALESPLRDNWIARISVRLPPVLLYTPAALGGGLICAFLGLVFHPNAMAGFILGAAVGAVLGLAAGWALRKTRSRETFTLGEFPESAFTTGFPIPRTLEIYSRQRRKQRGGRGLSIQLWGELRSQVEPDERDRLDRLKKRLGDDLAAARAEEAELIFLDRSINSLRERMEAWRERLTEVETHETGRGFSGDIFPADGPRKVYEHLQGREAAEGSLETLLARMEPSAGAPVPMDILEEAATAWGRERALAFELKDVLEVLDDRPEDLLDRLSEASAPLWPRPGDRDELLRCFGEDFARFAKDSDLRHSLTDETIFIRVLGGIRSGELART
ncbi:MAG TPA: hypothetical protein VMT52_10890 [Planctomycetota bacterium]|nr:hypothetical protein [Planctomycetota bacterium]